MSVVVRIGLRTLVAVVLALLLLDEPARPLLLVGALSIVGGSVALGLEPQRPEGFRRAGLAFALLTTLLFASRDDLLRWLATDTNVPPLPAAAVAMAGGAA